MPLRLTAAVMGALFLASAAHAGEPDLYYQSADYATMLCDTPQAASVANAISHGYAYGAEMLHKQWLEEQTANKTCRVLAPGQKFMTSAATAFYMRSLNDVRWLVQVLPPSNKSRPAGWVPIEQLRFLPF
jgi:hypothetical protein